MNMRREKLTVGKSDRKRQVRSDQPVRDAETKMRAILSIDSDFDRWPGLRRVYQI